MPPPAATRLADSMGSAPWQVTLWPAYLAASTVGLGWAFLAAAGRLPAPNGDVSPGSLGSDTGVNLLLSVALAGALGGQLGVLAQARSSSARPAAPAAVLEPCFSGLAALLAYLLFAGISRAEPARALEAFP